MTETSMGKRQKKIVWITGIATAILVLLMVFMVFLPRFINLESVKEKIRAGISQNVGGQVAFQRIDLSFFPRPRAIIHQVKLSIPGKVNGDLKSLTAYPKIFPLLTGRLRIAELNLTAPDIYMNLSDLPGEHGKNGREDFLEKIEQKMTSWLDLAASKTPGLTVVVNQGKLNLMKKNQPELWFRNVHARVSLPPDKLTTYLACQSNLWENMSFKGRLEPKKWESDGNIRMTRFQPHLIRDYLFPSVAPRVGKSQINLNLSFHTEGPRIIHARINGSFPLLTLIEKDRKSVIKGKSLKGSFDLEKNKTTISLSELKLDYPQLDLTGTFSADRLSPRISLELKGKNVDVYSTRQTVLALLGKIRVVREIFDIVKGGKIPDLAFSADGASAVDLGKMENIRIQGSMREGEIHVPKVELNLENISGKVAIAKGILEGKELEGRMGNSLARHGSLRLGLARGDDAPFRLETTIHADLAQLPPILKRLVDNQTFLQEMNLIENLEGKGEGRLDVEKSQGRVRTTVAVRKFNLFARYQRIFSPLEIENGKFFYDENRISATDLSGVLGNSSFSGFSVWLDHKENGDFKVLSGKAVVLLDEIYPWLQSLERLNDPLRSFKIVRGILKLDHLEISGPLLKPKNWRFQTTGEMENLFIDSAFSQCPLALASGNFQAVPEKLSFTNAAMSIMDSSLKVSSHLNIDAEGLRRIELTLAGDMGHKSIECVSNTIGLPSELRLHPPLVISNSQLLWDKNAETSFSGNLAVKNGPMLSIDILWNPEELTIKDLVIQDEKSQAFFDLVLKNKVFDLGFNGNLKQSSLDALLIENQFLEGWIEGDLRLRILMDQPAASTIKGKLQGSSLNFPWKFETPLKINRFSLESEKNGIKLNPVIITLEQSRLVLEGNANLAPQGILLDLDLSCDHFYWDTFKKIIAEEDRTKDKDRRKTSFRDLPVEGVLRTRSNSFQYEGFTWAPFVADIFFAGDEIRIETKKAELCGIDTPGILKISPREIRLDFKPVSENKDLDSTLNCLWNQKGLAQGNFNFEGHVFAQAHEEALIHSLQGEMELTAEKGRIYRFGLLSKIFALLNVTEILRGKLPDLSKEGFAYNFLNIKADLHGGKLGLEEAVIDGPSLEIACKGEVDLVDEKMDLTVLIAPFKTVDLVIKHIPLLKDALQGNLVSIPVRVTGDWKEPRITPLSPSAVTSEVLGIMKRTLKLPVKIIQPLIKE